jgi:thymidylate synthase ThyX
MEVTFPRIVLAEFNTHRMFSRNSASSRAIPVEKILKKIEEDPFIPVYWGKNQKGMQANVELSDSEKMVAEHTWLRARDKAIKQAKVLLDLGVHKQITNRLLEPWLWHTVIVSATDWENFFALRLHPDAQPEIRKGAFIMKDAYDASGANLAIQEGWHLPLVPDLAQLLEDKFTIEQIQLISVGRCARVSYLTHNGTREPQADIDLALKLQSAGHMSPFEHVARPMTLMEEARYQMTLGGKSVSHSGNFRGWIQLRKQLPNEDNFRKVLESR